MLTATISGCSSCPEGSGAPTASASVTAEPTTDPPQPTEDAQPDSEDPQEAAEEPQSDSESPNDASDANGPREPAGPAGPAAGEIALSWTGGTDHQNFVYAADHCYIGADHIRAEGVGGPIDAPQGSSIEISTSPEELLHAGTGTFQAQGVIRFTWGGTEIVADGRPGTVGRSSQPAVFTYQQTGDGVKYVVAWFEGAHDSGAGAVEVRCND